MDKKTIRIKDLGVAEGQVLRSNILRLFFN